jgi:putative zinc finger protein
VGSMTLEGCRRWRELLGAYLLDRLTPKERVGLTAHLDGCADCRSELEELRPVAASLSAADPVHIGTRPEPPAELAERVFANVRAVRRAHARRRWLVRGMAGLAAASIALSVALVLKPEPKRDREDFAFTVLPAGVVAEATLYHRTAGVEVWIQVEGLQPGATYSVWVERLSGERVRCGTFNSVTGDSHIVLPSTVQRPDTAAVGVSDRAGRVVMRAPVTPPQTA